MLFDFFVNISEFACFRELTKSGVITIQRFTFLLLCLSKVVHFIGAVDLWREILVQFRNCCVIMVVSPVSGKLSNISSTSGPA